MLHLHWLATDNVLFGVQQLLLMLHLHCCACNVDEALIAYEQAADMGYDVAQTNAAWLATKAAAKWSRQLKHVGGTDERGANGGATKQGTKQDVDVGLLREKERRLKMRAFRRHLQGGAQGVSAEAREAGDYFLRGIEGKGVVEDRANKDGVSVSLVNHTAAWLYYKRADAATYTHAADTEASFSLGELPCVPPSAQSHSFHLTHFISLLSSHSFRRRFHGTAWAAAARSRLEWRLECTCRISQQPDARQDPLRAIGIVRWCWCHSRAARALLARRLRIELADLS
jgi:hypothetical protein